MTVHFDKPLTINRAALSPSQLIGRQSELQLIWSQYKAVKNGSTRIMLVAGEPGIGKTRLLEEIAVCAVQDGAIVLRGGASESEGMPPYLPFLEVLGQYLHVTSLETLREQIAFAPQILVSILPELALRLGELPDLYPLPPEQMRLRLYEAIGNFLAAISRQQVLILMLDDLHWADSASLELLCHIVLHHSKASLLILGTYQEDEVRKNPALARAITELIHQRALTKIMLHRLSARETEDFAISCLGGSVSPDACQLLYEHSEGNPFFIEELILGWVEESALIQKDNLWIAVDLFDHALPPSIVGALRQRFARISSDVIDILRIAAIIGRTFDLSLLATIQGQEVEVVEEHLREAVGAGLIRNEKAEVFVFSHDKIRECLYAEVSSSRRRRLHETIGRLLEAQYSQENIKSSYRLAELAYHFTHSGEREKGAIYSQQAAEQALQISAFAEAMAHYRTALELLEDDDQRRGNVLLGLGEAALLSGAEHEAATAYKESLACLLLSGKLESAVRSAHGLGLALWRQNDFEAAQSSLEHALNLLGNDASQEKVHVLVNLATLLMSYMGLEDEGSAYAQQALDMANSLGDNSLIAITSRVIAAKLYISSNDILPTLEILEQTLIGAEVRDDLAEAAECCYQLSNRYYWIAEIKHSYQVSLRRIAFIERSQQSYLLWNGYAWIALLLTSQGVWAEAEQAIKQAQSTVNHSTNLALSLFLHNVQGFLAYQRGDYVTAEREFRTIAMNQQRGPMRFMFYTGLLGLVQAAMEKREEAYAYMSELEEILTELPIGTLPTAPIMVCLALTAVALGDQVRAANLYPKLLAFSGHHYWFLVDRVLGMIAIVSENWEMAALHLAAAEATARREGLQPELARTILSQADLEIARGGSRHIRFATNLLKSALLLFEELKMVDGIDQVRNRLRNFSPKSHGMTSRLFPANLTEGEVRVLRCVAKGMSNRQIAQELSISEKTVANHLSHIFGKTGSENRTAATAFAIHHELA